MKNASEYIVCEMAAIKSKMREWDALINRVLTTILTYTSPKAAWTVTSRYAIVIITRATIQTGVCAVTYYKVIYRGLVMRKFTDLMAIIGVITIFRCQIITWTNVDL